MYNPSLRREPRYEPAGVIPLKQDSSLIDWLTANGRIIPRENKEVDSSVSLEADEEISDLIDVDDSFYVDDDDIVDDIVDDDIVDDDDII